MDDLFAAMRLFFTTYFSEGNRISPRERRLTELVDALEAAVRAWEWSRVVRVVNEIVAEADLGNVAGVQMFAQ